MKFGDHHHFGLLQAVVLQQLAQMYFRSVYKCLAAAPIKSWAQIASKKILFGLFTDAVDSG